MVYQLFRRYQQSIMIFVSLATIIGLVSFYSNASFMDKSGSGKVAVIYGRTIPLVIAQRGARKADLCYQLAQMEIYGPREQQGLLELWALLSVSQRDAKENFIWNSMVLKHEATQLGIEPTEDEVFEATKGMTIFQTNGVYDSQKFNALSDNALAPRGLTTEDLSDLVADSLRLKKIMAVLGATVTPATADIRETFARTNQKTEAAVVRFKFDDFLATTQVPEEDVKKLYEERKGTLKTDELRKVKFVAFILPTTDKPLEGKARGDKLTELQKQAEDFSVAMTDKNAKLDEIAAKLGAKVEESPEFSIAKPPEALGSSSEVANAAFKLNQQQPNSDVIETARGYYVLQLVGITPPRPLAFEEAKANLTDTLKHERAQEAMNLKASEVRNKIEAEMKAGKTFAAAAEAAGVKPENIPAFSPKEPGNAGNIVQTVSEMNEGELSKVLPEANSSLIVYLSKRLPIDEKELDSEKAKLTDGIAFNQGIALFQEWLKLRRAAAQLKTGFRAS
jgi:peptidyl-prolyl cis-trans isomerase D